MGDPNGKFYKEGNINAEATYQPRFDNPDWYSGRDIMLYLVVNPLASNAEVKIDTYYSGKQPSSNTARNQ